jgi:hypothetical protein
MSNRKYRYSFDRFNLSNGVTDDEVNEVLEKLKIKDYYGVHYQIDQVFDRIITPEDFNIFFDDVKKWLNKCDVKLTEEQLSKVNNYIKEYTEKYNGYINKYKEILQNKQDNCSHPKDKIDENIYYDHATCMVCGKQLW